ncbi:MAG TPA: FAD-dependent oxidoreductase [Vicinamibacteria bacterium]|nr:FAD-dependent oxidoreductase [Vicinamibacteria bacterium]
MDRRSALKGAGLFAAGALLDGCSSRGAPRASADRGVPTLKLPKVDVSEERIIRTTVGLRPFRPPGFRVERENLGQKIIVHNYGHGGGGLSLSWGSSHLAVEKLSEDGNAPGKVAVLGCGALGLSTARLLQQRGTEVTIYAKDVPPLTTSNVAAGQWSPFSVAEFRRRTPEFDAQIGQAARFSYRYFQGLVGSYYGVRWLTNYVLSDSPFGGSGEAEGIVFPETRDLRPGEHPFPTQHARQFVTMLIEPHTYLGALMRDFQLAGGRVVVRELRDVDEIRSLPESAIMNCTGLGAKALFDDQELTPVKGQLTFLLPQPEVDYITLLGDLYMMPRSDGILLGGTFERGEWSLDVDEEALARIVEGHKKFFTEMRS